MKRVIGFSLMALTVQLGSASEIVKLTPEQQARAGTETAAVEMAAFGSRLPTVGEIVRSPGSTLGLKTIASGRVESLLVSPGEPVRAGQPVVLLHSHELLTMQSDLLLANDQLKLAEQRVAAGRELMSFDGISQLELERRQQEALSARLRVDTVREELLDHGVPAEALASVEASQRMDPHLPVTSPIDGVILEVMVQEQEWVQSYAPLLTVGDPARVELELQVAPDQAGEITVGDSVEFQPVGATGMAGRATVITQVPQIDPSTRTIRIRARIDRGRERSFPGAFVEAVVVHGEVRQSLAIPDTAVISVAGEDSVFVATGDGVFEPRPVTLGLRDGDRYEVVEGLSEGEEVATAGVFFLKSALVKGEGEGD
jgi:cobalt-zinc-cadmium efflux system membrane fusion protein